MKLQKGFTLLELMIVMVIIGILIGPLMNIIIANIEQRRADVAIGEITDLYTSAQNFAANNAGAWPDQASDCANAISVMQAPAQSYLVGFRTTTVYATTYTTSCPVPGAGQRRFNISLNVGDNDIARLLAGTLPSATASGTTVSASIPLPAELPAFDLMLPRDGSRPMTGDLDMDGNKIKNAELLITRRLDRNNADLEETATLGNGTYFAGIVNANANTEYFAPICEDGSVAIPIVVPAGNSPTVTSGNLSSGGQPEANPIGAQYAWAEPQDTSGGRPTRWKFLYKMAVYKNNQWKVDHMPNPASNFLAVYMKCT